ncbi:MAG: thioredoxin family protein [Akkermansia sp.]|nr:thioredoxin family protein [Akkermansia sp.]
MNTLRYLLLAFLSLAGMAQAQFSFDQMGTPSCITAKGSASCSSYKAGEPFYIALDADIKQPWHGYFRNPGTVGDPMTAELKAPEGFKVEGPYFSAPELHKGVIGVAYTYQNPTVVWRVTPEAAAPQEASFTASCTAQVCSDEGCNPPETQSATIELKAGDAAANADWQHQEQKVETLSESPLEYTMAQEADTVTISLPALAAAKNVYFFSDDNCISPTAEQKFENGTLSLKRNDNSDPMYSVKDEAQVGKPLKALGGLLVADGKLYTIKGEFAAPAPKSPFENIPAGLGGVLLSLFLGGLILNLMPCVFPVIGLKVMSFVELGGGDRRKVIMHSLAFVLGILVSFWIISVLIAVVSNLSALADQPWTQWLSTLWYDGGSTSRSWAEWMQNPWIVYVILLLLLVLGLSMFGLFEIGVGATGAGQKLQSKGGLTGSFFQGLFVTVVATPCSAPFLGTSLPAAMSMPAVWMVVALTFMALGLAFPYIVLGCFPSLVRLLPKPGPWMESLKQGLSFLLFGAAAWFVDVYLVFWPKSENTTWVLIGLVLIACAFWVYGRWCPMYRSKGSRISGGIIALALLACGAWISIPVFSAHEWKEWSSTAMQDALDEGHPVYVDFTAKWCATCQSNKKLAYTDEVYKAFEDHDVVLMRADKTKPSEEIDAAMRKLNRSSVPVNVLYIPDREPAVTSELLTAPYMLDFLNEQFQDADTEDTDGQDEQQPDGEEA